MFRKENQSHIFPKPKKGSRILFYYLLHLEEFQDSRKDAIKNRDNPLFGGMFDEKHSLQINVPYYQTNQWNSIQTTENNILFRRSILYTLDDPAMLFLSHKLCMKSRAQQQVSRNQRREKEKNNQKRK